MDVKRPPNSVFTSCSTVRSGRRRILGLPDFVDIAPRVLLEHFQCFFAGKEIDAAIAEGAELAAAMKKPD